MLVTLLEVKGYLRVDSSDEDSMITQLMSTAEYLVSDVCRMSSQNLASQGDVVKTAELYAIAYLYEHREDADHKELLETLKSLLFVIREEAF